MLLLKLSDTRRDTLNAWLDERRVLLCHNADHARCLYTLHRQLKPFSFRIAIFLTCQCLEVRKTPQTNFATYIIFAIW
jgi:hypothetical protein